MRVARFKTHAPEQRYKNRETEQVLEALAHLPPPSSFFQGGGDHCNATNQHRSPSHLQRFRIARDTLDKPTCRVSWPAYLGVS